MLLVEFNINGTLHYLSIEGHDLAHNWKRKIVSIDPLQYAVQGDHGGYCRLELGQIVFTPDLFANDWPPPLFCPITIKFTESNEATAQTLFAGTAHLQNMTFDQVAYEIYDTLDYSALISDGTEFDDTLANVFTALCDPTQLNLSIDTTYARSPSPGVVHTVDGDQRTIDFLDNLARFYAHLFYIDSATSTLHLVDMYADAGSRTLTNFFPPHYEQKRPAASVTDGTYKSYSMYVYGEAVEQDSFHDTEANIVAAQADILYLLSAKRCSVRMPLTGTLPTPGERISWTDSELLADTNTQAYIRARIIQYDFDNDEVIITGEGRLTVTDDYLLMESGDALLLESGDKIII